MHIKDEVLSKGYFNINDGTSTRFWEDTWLAISRSRMLTLPYTILHGIGR
jgi:hypothetical protein